jgi:hypothetical protein
MFDDSIKQIEGCFGMTSGLCVGADSLADGGAPTIGVKP